MCLSFSGSKQASKRALQNRPPKKSLYRLRLLFVRSVFQSVTLAADGDNRCAVQKAVQDSRSGGHVAQQFAPSCLFIVFRLKTKTSSRLISNFDNERSFRIPKARWRRVSAATCGQSFSSLKYEYGRI